MIHNNILDTMSSAALKILNCRASSDTMNIIKVGIMATINSSHLGNFANVDN